MSEPGDDRDEPHNRTGIAGFRDRSIDMLAGAVEFAPPPAADASALARARVRSAKASGPVGTTPPLSRRDGLRVLGVRGESLAPELAEQLLDRLGERLGSERTSVRMYEALLTKFDALSPAGAPARTELERLLREEFDHYRMLEETVAELGGDPTAITPAADVAATMMKGMLEVLLDPRTRFAQCLEAVLMVELMDTEQWRVLAELTQQLGEHTAAARFAEALRAEQEHLDQLRRWLAGAQGRTAR